MMFRSILTVAALVSFGAMPAAAAPKGGVADTKSGQTGWTKNTCFGQARGWWASSLGQGTNPSYEPGTSNGDVLSDLAQNGTMHDDNEAFIEDYCG